MRHFFLRCSEVGRWDPIPSFEIIDKHGGELYDSDNTALRAPIDIDNFPELFDADGREIHIYTPAGIPIPRLAAILPEDGPRFCALLPDLSKCRSLFVHSDSLDLREDDEGDAMEVENELEINSNVGDVDDLPEVRASRVAVQRDVAFQVYPTAFTHTMGNWQAKGIIRPLALLLIDINKAIRRAPGVCPAVEPSISQCYNNFSHHTRRSAGQHIVQRGILTGVATGAWATNGTTHATASKLFERVESDLPHKALEEQVENVDETCLRFENVFTIHFNRLAPRFLDGGQFFDSVIEPLIQACGHPNVFNALRDSTIILKPQVILVAFNFLDLAHWFPF